MKLKCNVKTLNAIAETLLEKWPTAKESAAVIREAARAMEAAKVFRDAFTYDPGHSDLDNEQPIAVHVTLGDWRRLNSVLAYLESTDIVGSNK